MSEEKSVTISSPWFGFIKSGKKKIEGRLNFGYFSHLKENDIIRLSNSEKTEVIKCVVKKIEKFGSFHELLDNERLKDVLPGIDTVEAGVEIFNKFYKPEDITKNGVLGITLAVEDSKSGGRARSKSKSKKTKSRSRSKGKSKK